jgi:hypothetical protein
VKLGSQSFSIAARKTRLINARLTARGFQLLIRVHRLSTHVRLRFSQPDGDTTTATRTITLVASKSSKR